MAESYAWCIVGHTRTSNDFVASSTGKAGTRQIIRDVQQHRESSTSRTTNISTLVRSRRVRRLVYSGTQQDLKCICCKLECKNVRTSDHPGRSRALRERGASQHENPRSSPVSPGQTPGLFPQTRRPQVHLLQARMEKLAHVRSFGTSNSSTRARRVAPKTPPH